MPRAALLSIHARVRGTGPSTWEDPSLVQLWGPRFSSTSCRHATAVFTLGRLPDDARGRRVAEEVAARLHAFLAGRRMTDREAGHGLGENPNRFRYAAPTGTWPSTPAAFAKCAGIGPVEAQATQVDSPETWRRAEADPPGSR